MPHTATQIPPLPAHYRIGIDAMDTQHARWIHLIEAFRKVGAGHLLEPAGIEAARNALRDLLEYTKLHFTSEEALLAEHRYPDFAAHCQAHRRLEAAVIALDEEIRSHANNTHSTPLKLNLLATIWLMEHITQEDRKYAKFILAQPTPKSPGSR